MKTFKLIAVRPLEKCSRRFSKNLNNGEIYPFYNDYAFLNKDQEPSGILDDVDRIICGRMVPDDFYAAWTADGHKLNVNISAVVGKNGSGKSTLMELFYAALYLFSVQEKLVTPNDESIEQRESLIRKRLREDKETESEIAEREKQKTFDLLWNFKNYTTNDEQYLEQVKQQVLLLIEREDILNNLEGRADRNSNKVQTDLQNLTLFRSQLAVEIYYEINGVFFRLSVNEGKSEVTVVQDGLAVSRGIALDKLFDEPFDLSSFFFYTISVNYSHYGLNSSFLGSWIRHLFHKNDGYLTPIVINPMRTDGDYKINDEIKFAKYRLLSNKLIEAKTLEKGSRVFMTEHQYIDRVRFTINRSKIKENFIAGIAKLTNGKQSREFDLLKDLYNVLYPGKTAVHLKTRNTQFLDLIGNYVFHKVNKISFTYTGFYEDYSVRKRDPEKNRFFLERIINESSHITSKLKQALHFLIHNEAASRPFDESILSGGNYIDYSLEELLEWMGGPDFFDVINHMPPSLFDIEFILKDLNDEKGESTFNDLSSGEQQMIHAVQCAVYHMNNLQSVNYSIVPRVSYSCVNIVFDEIELYFHPEYQRKFVNELLQSFGKMYFGNREGIKSVNIQFLTHSPFILSDIPRNNILKLANGDRLPMDVSEKTFGANIHEQLTHSFFMDSTIGEYAGSKIERIIDFYYLIRRQKNSKELEKYQELYSILQDEFYFIAENVGEDVISGLLKNHIEYIEEFLDIRKKNEEDTISE